MSFAFWLGADRTAAGDWVKLSERKPPLHNAVLIRLKEGIGEVCDVACYIGKDADGLDSWILGDVRLESRQITHWAPVTAKVAV